MIRIVKVFFVFLVVVSLARPATLLASEPDQPPPALPATNSAASQQASIAQRPVADGIAIEFDGKTIAVGAQPIVLDDTVYVPLTGVLDKIGAVVQVDNQTGRIEITTRSGFAAVRLGQATAVANMKLVTLSSVPRVYNNSIYIPLRALAQLFCYEVDWSREDRVVSILTAPGPHLYTDHRVALKAGGPFGIEADFTGTTPAQAAALLDDAKLAGAGMLKIRFDWDSLEPQEGKPFNWKQWDTIVRGARERNLIVVGILGNSAHWASLYNSSDDPVLWRNGPPSPRKMAAWSNYVRRVVGRYRNDVQAWQVWERTSSDTFRSGFKNYLQVYSLAAAAARESDPKAIVHFADPGGLDLGYIENFDNSVPAADRNGVSLYPVSGFRPGVLAAPEAFLQPFSLLRQLPQDNGQDMWVGGLSFPVVGEKDSAPRLLPTGFNSVAAKTSVAGIAGADAKTTQRLLETFTPQAQADYLTKASTLALAAGAGKLFWSNLRDPAQLESVEPINPVFGAGLLRNDFSPRPAFAAYRMLTRLVGDKRYVGAVAAGPDAVVLVFDNGTDGCAVAWGLRPGARLVFGPDIGPAGPVAASPAADAATPAVASPAVSASTPVAGSATVGTVGPVDSAPGTVLVQTRADAQILDSTGVALSGASGDRPLTDGPLWITHIGANLALSLNNAPAAPLLLKPVAADWGQDGVNASFTDAPGAEHGLYWRGFDNFRGAIQKEVEIDGRQGLQSEISTDVFKPADGRYFLFLDVSDQYLYATPGIPVEISVEVHRTTPGTGPFQPKGGFSIEYGSLRGTQHTPWQTVDGGVGWATYTYRLTDADFTDDGGFDLMINTFGSQQNLTFGSVKVRKLEPKAG